MQHKEIVETGWMRLDLIEEAHTVGGLALSLVRPRSSEALLDEEAFEREEFLPYWAELWPSALALGRALVAEPLAGRRVLELGCGLGVPSIVAALRGAYVLATDWSADAVAVTAENARRNGATLATALASWSEPDELAAEGPWELVLASDLLYERRNVELLIDLLPQLVAEGTVFLADPGRPFIAPFLAAARPEWLVESADDGAVPNVEIHRLRKAAA